MRVDAEGEVGGWHSFSPVETASRAVPRARSEGEPNQAGVQVSCAGVSDNRVNSPPGGSDSDFPPPVQSRGLSSSSRARPLFWLCQSPPLAWPVSLVTLPVHPRSRLPARATWCFSASSPACAAPRFKQHHLQQVGIKTQSPCSIAHRERGLAAESGLRAPKAAPAPPCLLEPPSTETQHFSIRQSSIYVGL